MNLVNHLTAIRIACVLCILFACGQAWADKLRPAYLQLSERGDGVISVVWRVPALGKEQRLSLMPEFSPETPLVGEIYDAHLGNTSTRQWSLKRPQGLAGLTINVPDLSNMNIEALVRAEFTNGFTTTHRLTAAQPSWIVPDSPTFWGTMQTYLVLGIEHILFGLDHLLFVLVLVILVKDRRSLLITVTSFTMAHSITLILASLGWVAIPIAPVEACIALSIVFVASEILKVQQGEASITQQQPWIMAFGFGLLHGLGFAAALAEIGLPESALISSLLVFNIGVELGQLVFIAAVIGLWQLFKTLSGMHQLKAWVEKIPPYAIGSLASFWVFERLASFYQ